MKQAHNGQNPTHRQNCKGKRRVKMKEGKKQASDKD